jgi:transcriptional regulator with XRE-family HTH domain
MHDAQVGRGLRAIRHRLGWRQEDVAELCGLSQQSVSRAESGRLTEMTIESLRAVATAIGGDIELVLRWRGAALDRLVDERHADLVGAIASRLGAVGWEALSEASYSEFGERGSIDILALHRSSGILLVVEIKTELGSVEETLRKHDEKVRLGPKIARARFGVWPAHVARLLVLSGSSTPRRQVDRHAVLFDRAYPLRGQRVNAWLREPARAVSGILFVSPTRGTSTGRVRISRRQRASSPQPVAEHAPGGLAGSAPRQVPQSSADPSRGVANTRGAGH